MTIKRVSGSEAVLLSLLEEGVDTIFGYPGGGIMPIYDALYDFDNHLTHYLTRHEQGAIHAADGYARVTGRAGVCFATSGPGATNLMTGLANAHMDSIPLVCITGQVTSILIGTDAFQEADVIGMTMPVTKWNYQVTRVEEIPEAIAKAFYIANSGRPGPVLIDIAKDTQFARFDFKYKKCTKLRSYVPQIPIDSFQIKAAADLINGAKKPLVLVGHGVILAQAEEELKEFIEKTGIPAAWTLLGLSALPSNHPLNVGMLGMHGNYGPNIKTNEADVLIAIGMRFDDRVTSNIHTYARHAKIIHLDIDPAEISKIIKADAPVLGNAKKSLKMLTENVFPNSHQDWVNEFRDCDKIEIEKVISGNLYPTQPDLTMGEVIRIASEKTGNDAILVTDVGQQQMIASRYFKFSQTRSNVTSGGLGTMGFALPAAMGAKIGAPNRVVFAVVGDGGFQMTIQELGTIEQYGLDIKIIVLNNNFLGMVRQWQEMFFEKRYSFTAMRNPDFPGIAKSYGLASQKVTSRDKLEGAIQEMLDHNGPYMLEVVVGKENNVFPMVPAGASISDILLEH
jgi:acetolactate synthase I/II/III large subunit